MKDSFVMTGEKTVSLLSLGLQNFLPDASEVTSAKTISVAGSVYALDCCLAFEDGEPFPKFGIVRSIFVLAGAVYFGLNCGLDVLGFDLHYRSFVLKPCVEALTCVRLRDMYFRHPMCPRPFHDLFFVKPRYRICRDVAQ